MELSIEKKMEDIVKTSETNDIEWALDDKENKGIYIRNNKFDTKIFVTWDALEKNDVKTILAQTVQGKDIDNITRVTGYLSVTSNWNKGKIAEFRDRYRVDINDCALN
ncbi:MAG: anaerobic ribonucleoside-triphosphate reductase [DPANN group archaeon]|nr:anaerobic ribonucleoside-triphosphate reductase [DPANN group archaeon]